MAKPKIKVREIKKDIKVTELKAPESKLEEKIEFADNSPIISSTTTSAKSPTLAQNLTPRFTESTRAQVRKGIQSKDREFSYASMISQPARSYDPSIRQGDRAQEQVAARRIDPSLSQLVSPIRPIQQNNSGPRDITDLQDKGRLETQGFDANKQYNSDRDVQKYMSKRRTDL